MKKGSTGSTKTASANRTGLVCSSRKRRNGRSTPPAGMRNRNGVERRGQRKMVGPQPGAAGGNGNVNHQMAPQHGRNRRTLFRS